MILQVLAFALELECPSGVNRTIINAHEALGHCYKSGPVYPWRALFILFYHCNV